VLVWSGEDSAKDTLVPRLFACGANLSRVHFIGQTTGEDGPRPFDPAHDFAALALEAARLPNLRLVIVDPIVSAVKGDSHRNAEVRNGLQPLVNFGEATGCAIVGISHFSKGTAGRDPVERVTGSLAFGALARLVFATVKETEENGGGRLLVRSKSNIGPDGGGFRYELLQVELTGACAGITASRPEWGAAVNGEAREILATAEQDTDPEERSALGEAEEFLRDLLAAGPVDSVKVLSRARGVGISEKTLRRAKGHLQVKSQKRGMDGGFEWQLPPNMAKSPEDAQQNVVAAFGKFGHLRADSNAESEAL
jgi:putative DNA primase/helicase